ncbi:aconitate hydratase AcnA [Bordetella hinzii]|nr:aconitate hydratase AcnA [Bordetella hinzii]
MTMKTGETIVTDPYLEVFDPQAAHGRHFSVPAFAADHGLRADRLPYVARVLIENALRHESAAHRERPRALALLRTYHADAAAPAEPADVWLHPTRVLAQDVSGIPSLIDLAAMRDVLRARGGDPRRINPLIPTDLIVDHSLIAEESGHAGARQANEAREYHQNRERYTFLKWAQDAFDNLRLVPPGKGILHQINLEYLADVATAVRTAGGVAVTCPDTLVGTDSHTTMINALGVLGWGVGGIEAEAAMLGDALVLRAPEIVGVRLFNRPASGITATDLVFNLTRILREAKVVAQFVEFTGEALDGVLSLEDRATLSNMAPEYGSTCAYFPVDEETLAYLARTGRSPGHVEAVRRYAQAAGLWRGPVPPAYSRLVEVDLARLGRVAAGPSRPQDRMTLAEVPVSFARATAAQPARPDAALPEGAVVLAAITSCTNTSNPRLLVAAGLLARKARALGLRPPAWTKTSFTPGSRVVTDYLRASGLQDDLDALGFHTAGYGCASCAGLSGSLPPEVEAAIGAGSTRVAAVLSGNRNFPGRVHPLARANYLVSPPMVVAYALAGTVARDLEREAVGAREDGRAVMLAELWPDDAEIDAVVADHVRPGLFTERYRDVFEGDRAWRDLPAGDGACYQWDADSLYLRRPPYLDVPAHKGRVRIEGARALLVLGDSVTTDHISPANEIPPASSAGRYLLSLGVPADGLHTYLARRGNHRVMMRATFAQPTLVNELLPQGPAGATRHQPDGAVLPIYDVAMQYRDAGVPVIVVAGKDYGNGSSRDWAAKGTRLLGVRAVVAESFERIHRSNLVNMGVLPLELPPGVTRLTLGLDGTEIFDLDIPASLAPRGTVACLIRGLGAPRPLSLLCRLDNAHEIEIWRAGGILPAVLRQALEETR